MKLPHGEQLDKTDIREKIIGLGEKSFRKSYYPALRKKLEDLELYKALLDQSNDAIFMVKVPSGSFLSVSRVAQRQTGYSEAESLTKTIYDLLPGHREQLAAIFSGKTESMVLDTWLVKKTGEKTPVEVNMRRVTSGKGVYVVVVARDITERKQAEMELLKSEEKFRQLSDSSPMPMASYDVAGKILYLNKKLTETYGYTREDTQTLKGWWRLAYHDPEYRRKVREQWSEHVENARRGSGDIEPMEARVICKDGSVRQVEFYGTVIGSQVIVILQDITERKRVEENLRFTRFAIDRVQDEAFWTTSDGHFIYVNDAACRALGYTREELLKLSVPEIDPLKPPEAFARHWQVLKEHGATRFESLHRSKDGRLYPVEIRENFVVFDGREYNCAFATDITERKRVEKAMVDAKAQAELYLDLMSHDLTNMNQALMGYLEMLELTMAPGQPEKGLVTSSMEIINRSSRLIEDVKKLTAEQAGKIPGREVNVCDMLALIKARYSNARGRPVTINYTAGPDCLVRADDLLLDVLENLTENAVRHSRGRPVTVSLAMERVLIEGKEWYEITVADTGPGIPDDLKNRIFKFIKESGEKSVRRGFGLYLVRTLIDHYGGRVWVEDRVPGDYTKGSKFVILLPIVTDRELR